MQRGNLPVAMTNDKDKDIFINLSNFSIDSSTNSEQTVNKNDFDITDTSNGDEYNECYECGHKIDEVDEKVIPIVTDADKNTIEKKGETIKVEIPVEKTLEEPTEKKKREYYVVTKYVKSVLKNKENEQMYKFYRYLVDKNIFTIFVEIFINLITNKKYIKNPYIYILNYFDKGGEKICEDIDETQENTIQKRKHELIAENYFYKKQNKILINKINCVEAKIQNLIKKNYTKMITDFCFQSKDQFNETYFFTHFLMKDNENLNISVKPSFMFTRESFSIFILFLNNSKRKTLYDILIDKKEELNDSSFFNKLLEKFQKFVNFYSSSYNYEQEKLCEMEKKDFKREELGEL